jgi:hypothetical protein
MVPTLYEAQKRTARWIAQEDPSDVCENLKSK